jgi:multiple sugar transport system permease protein
MTGGGRRTRDAGVRERALPVAGRTGVATLLVLGALASLLPFVWMISFSFGRPGEFLRLPPPILPSAPRLDNYVEVFEQVPFLSFLWNSTLVTVVVVVGQLITSSTAAYAFARLDFPGKGPLFILLLASLMIPFQLTVIPLFLMMRSLGLVDTLPALIIPWLGNVFGVFLLRQYFATIPREIDEAAQLDGAGRFRIFYRFIIPMSAPALASLAILSFNATWNSFLWPLISINPTEKMPLPLGMTFLNGQQVGAGATGVVMAGVTLSVLPPLFVFLLLQRRLVDGIAMTSGGG